MAFSYAGGATARGTSTTASVTHGLTINSGDLVVAYINRNDAIAVSNDAGGAAWTNPVNESISGQTAQQALFWKVAGASEPSSYSWTLNGNDLYQLILKVFTSASDAEVDAAASTAVDASSSQNMVCEAIDGEVISDDAVSLIFGGKDARGTGGTYVTADNSYVSVLGETDDQDACGAHRIYTTGTTFSGPVTFTDPGPSSNDRTYSAHISFVEGSGGAFTLEANSGSFALTGTVAELQRGLIFAANSGSFSLSGTSADLLHGRHLGADSGSFSLSGAGVDLLRGLVLGADSGSYALSGTDVTLTYTPLTGFTLSAESGSFSLSGDAVAFLIGRVLSIESGGFLFAGSDAALVYSEDVTAGLSTGAYSRISVRGLVALSVISEDDMGVWSEIEQTFGIYSKISAKDLAVDSEIASNLTDVISQIN